jgi:hypothetical protein
MFSSSPICFLEKQWVERYTMYTHCFQAWSQLLHLDAMMEADDESE